MDVSGHWRRVGVALGVMIASGLFLAIDAVPAWAQNNSPRAQNNSPSQPLVGPVPKIIDPTRWPGYGDEPPCGCGVKGYGGYWGEDIYELMGISEADAQRINADARNAAANKMHLGVYGSNGSTAGGGWDAAIGGGAAVTRGNGNGYGVTDAAGILVPGKAAPSFKDVTSGGGIKGSVDASHFYDLPTNQRLNFGAFFGYQRDNMTLGTNAGLAAAGIGGSAQTDNYALGGSLNYKINTVYLKAIGAFNIGRGSETEIVDGSTGSFNTRGYGTDLRLGNVFMLANAISYSNTGRSKKAPPQAIGGYIVGLDVSGHLGYSNQQLNGFTDSSGFIYGTDQTRYGDIGGRAMLFAVVPSNGLLWMPYVGGTVDQQFGFSSTLTIPVQAALASGDVVTLQQARTFWGGQLGLDVRGAGGLTVGVKGFYSASADTNTAGGRIYVKIPFAPVVASRY